MAYVKNTWVDREGQTRYHETIDDDGALIFTPDYEKVTELGTPVNADNMNHIEEGIENHENRITVLEEAGDASNFLNKSQITNCLLEVPQNIKLELADGVLTLKAGSKVIVPNGAGVFEEVEITSDKTYTQSANGAITVYYNPAQSRVVGFYSNADMSGTDVGSNTNGKTYYDTDDNKISRYDNGSLTFSVLSFPIARVTVTDGVITSIDQVFNGMGYIGSTIWVDKGVKGLIPNGRNEDGTLRNIEFTTSKVLTKTYTGSSTIGVCLREANIGWYSLPSMVYKTEENINYDVTKGIAADYAFCGQFTINNGVISNFQPKLAFRAVDYNDALLKSDKQEISGWGMPSTKKISLTAGASGSQYTAPANGYFVVQSNNASGELGLWNNTAYIGMKSMSTNNKNMDVFVPAQKSDTVTIAYVSTTIKKFVFVYAQGEV